jgi:hypothetical protein
MAGLAVLRPAKGFCKMLICAILLGMECLPKGGTISMVQGSRFRNGDSRQG